MMKKLIEQMDKISSSTPSSQLNEGVRAICASESEAPLAKIDCKKEPNNKSIQAAKKKAANTPAKVDEARADPAGAWFVYGEGPAKKFKTHAGAKKYMAANGGKIASAEYYYDKIKNTPPAKDDRITKEGVIDTIKRGAKSIKRGVQGWAMGDHSDLKGNDPGPTGVRKRNMNYDDDTTKMLHSTMKWVDTTLHSPVALQKRVIDREMKKRGLSNECTNRKKVSESVVGTGVTVILEGVRFRVSDPSLAKVLRRFPHETENFNAGAELADHLYDALYDHYCANGEMPYPVMKARDGDPFEWVSQRLSQEMGSSPVTEGEDSPLDRIIHQFSHEVAEFKQHGELEGDLYDALYDHYFDDMPYGVKKARSGDPTEWVSDRFYRDLESDAPLAETDQPDQIGAGDEEQLGEIDEAVLLEEPAEHEIVAALANVGLDDGLDFFFEGGLVVIGRSTAKVAINALRNAGLGSPKISEIDGEAIRITFNKQPAPIPDRNDIAQLSREPGLEEGFGSTQMINGKVVDTRSIERDPSDFSVADGRIVYAEFTDGTPLDDDQLIQLTHDQEVDSSMPGITEDVAMNVTATGEDDVLNIIRKLSGMPEVESATRIEPISAVEETVDTPEDGTYANEPDQEVHTSTSQMMSQGNDLNRPKRQFPMAANRAANPMAEARNLMSAYDSLMKDVTK